MQYYVIDFETYYDQDFTLSKLPTDSYVLDPRFKVHMMGMRWPDGRCVWYGPPTIPGALQAIDWKNAAIVAHNAAFDGFILTQHYKMPQPKLWIDTLAMARPLIGVEVGGSLAAVAEHFNLPMRKGDELVTTKGVRDLSVEQANVLGDYCVNDVNLCWHALRKMAPQIPAKEMRLIDLTVRCFTDPKLHLDGELLRGHFDSEVARKAELIERVVGGKDVLMSNDKFAEALRSLGVEPPMKVSAAKSRRAGEEVQTYAFAKNDAEFTALLDHTDDTVRELVEARLGVKSTIEETRAKRLLSIADDDRALPIMYNYCGAHTTRWSGANKMNLQNFGRKSPLRRALKAPPGMVVCVADSAQIEARTVAENAGQEDLTQAFREKRDVYAEAAGEVYRRPINKKDHPIERFVGKVQTLGLGYGMGWPKFAQTLMTGAMGDKVLFGSETVRELALDVSWLQTKGVLEKVKSIPSVLPMRTLALHSLVCNHVVNTWRAKNHKIVQYWDRMDEAIEVLARGGTIDFGCYRIEKCELVLPSGLRMRYPNLRYETGSHNGRQKKGWFYSNRRERVSLYGGKFVENITQAVARCVVSDQMLEISKELPIVMMTHDEVVALAPKHEADTAVAFMVECMSRPPSWLPTLPVAAEGDWAERYGDAK